MEDWFKENGEKMTILDRIKFYLGFGEPPYGTKTIRIAITGPQDQSNFVKPGNGPNAAIINVVDTKVAVPEVYTAKKKAGSSGKTGKAGVADRGGRRVVSGKSRRPKAVKGKKRN